MNSKPNRTTFSVWPTTLHKVNRLKGELAERRGESIDIDTLLAELVDHYRATCPVDAEPVRRGRPRVARQPVAIPAP